MPFDAAPNTQTNAELTKLLRLRELLSNPKHWHKNSREGEHHNYCLLGAISMVECGHPYRDYNRNNTNQLASRIAQTIRRAAAEIEFTQNKLFSRNDVRVYTLLATDRTDSSAIFLFNDCRATTHDMILDIIDRAIIACEAELCLST